MNVSNLNSLHNFYNIQNAMNFNNNSDKLFLNMENLTGGLKYFSK